RVSFFVKFHTLNFLQTYRKCFVFTNAFEKNQISLMTFLNFYDIAKKTNLEIEKKSHLKMKNKLTILILLLTSLGWIACSKSDLKELRSELERQKELLAQLQSTLNSLNTDIKGLQAIT